MGLNDNELESIVNDPDATPVAVSLARALLACRDTIHRLERKIDDTEKSLKKHGLWVDKGGSVMLNEFIERAEGVCGGEPVIAGTRIDVRHIWQLHALGKALCDIIKDYPQLSLMQVDAAIQYARAHPELQKDEEE